MNGQNRPLIKPKRRLVSGFLLFLNAIIAYKLRKTPPNFCMCVLHLVNPKGLGFKSTLFFSRFVVVVVSSPTRTIHHFIRSGIFVLILLFDLIGLGFVSKKSINSPAWQFSNVIIFPRNYRKLLLLTWSWRKKKTESSSLSHIHIFPGDGRASQPDRLLDGHTYIVDFNYLQLDDDDNFWNAAATLVIAPKVLELKLWTWS